MKLKKEILESPFFMLLIILVIIIGGIYIVGEITYKQPENDETINEPEIIDVTPFSDFDWSKLNRENDFITYEDDKYTSMIGIDVAAHQETIDWKKVKQAGVEFAYIRLGYRGCSEGILHTDLEFEKNLKGATENGILVGIYWYSQPISEIEAIEEAKYVIDVLDGRHIDLPIAYDFEETFQADGTISRMHDMPKQDRTKMAVAFCNEIIKNHQDVMIYTNLDWAENYYDWNELEDYPVWFAQYSSYPEFDRPLVMWQYEDNGFIDGIDRSTDFDILFIRKNNQN